MTKKFVKTDFATLAKKEEKPPPSYYRTNNGDRSAKPRPRQSSAIQEKQPTIDLRRYFEVCPASEEIAALVSKFPWFFTDLSLHPEQVRSGRPQNDSFKIGSAYNPSQMIEEDDMPNWESDGEVELGEKISEQIVNRMQNIERRNMGELKQHEKEFLEEELRQKRQGTLECNKPPKSAQKNNQSKFEPTQRTFEDSDEEVEVKRSIQIVHHDSATQLPSSLTKGESYPEEVFNIADDQDDDDDRFKESSKESDDDDIFGSDGEDSNGKQKHSPAENPVPAATHGHIKIVKGEFSLFALSCEVSEDRPVWAISNGMRAQSNLTSEWMDSHYLQQCYPHYMLVCFDPNCNNFIPYQNFHNTHDIKFFQVMNSYGKKANIGKKNYQQGQYATEQQYNHQVVPVGSYQQPRKMSGQDIKEPNIRPPGRKHSNNYKIKPQQK